jgi:hypothetical protein
MTRKSLTRRGYGHVALLGLAWMLLAGQGLCDSVPEPLQNRQTQTEASPEAAAPKANTVVVPQTGTSAAGSGGNQETHVLVTPSVAGSGAAVSGSEGPAAPGLAVPAEQGKALPGTTVPGQGVDQKDKNGSTPAKATVSGGNQETQVLVAPPVLAVPGVIVPGTEAAVTGPGRPLTPGKVPPAPGFGAQPAQPAAPSTGPPVQVAPDSKVLDEAGHPVNLPPGQEVVLPRGGKVVDGQGQAAAVPPGGRVILAAPAMTPGDFLPKTGKPKKTPPQPAEPKSAKPQVKTDPEKQGKPQSEAAPQSGDRFKIAQDACQKHTLDFLKGCWQGKPVLRDKTQVSTRLCFDENGIGKRFDKNFRSKVECVAPMKAAWSGSNLSFSFKLFRCSDGHPRTDVPVICNGCGEKTQCLGSEYREGKGMVGKTQYEIVKE